MSQVLRALRTGARLHVHTSAHTRTHIRAHTHVYARVLSRTLSTAPSSTGSDGSVHTSTSSIAPFSSGREPIQSNITTAAPSQSSAYAHTHTHTHVRMHTPVSGPRHVSSWELLKSVLSAGKAARKAKKAAAAGVASGATGEKSEKQAENALGRISTHTLTQLLTFAKPEAIPLTASLATLGVTTGISLLFPYAIGRILDVALAPADALSPSGIAIGLLALFCVQSGMIVLRSALLTSAGERMAAHMRKHVFASALAQEAAWFDAQRTGDIINRLSSDTLVIQKALTNNLAGGLRSAAMAVGGAGMLVYLSPPLAALSLALIPPVAIAGMYYGQYLEGQQKAVQEALGRTTQVAEEIISAIRTVRQFARERDEVLRYGKRVDDAYESARQIGMVAAYFDGAVHMAANVSLIAVLWYGGTLVSTGGMSAGDLTAFLMYSLYTGFNVANLSNVYTELKRATGAASRIFEITNRSPVMPLSSDAHYWQPLQQQDALTDGTGLFRRLPVRSGGDAVVFTSAMHAVGATGLRRLEGVSGDIQFDNVSFAYPTRADSSVLQGCNLHVPAGKTIALVGGSGSGKSTVGALLTRLYDPPAGRITLDGVDIRELDPTWFRSVIGTVAQEPVLFAGSIADNIRYGRLDATDEEVERVARIAHAHDFITQFPDGFHTDVGERGVQLSGGQKQRIAIARALLKDPRVLLLDEATSALDASSEAAIVDAMKEISRGRSVITIAHRLSTMQMADLVAVLHDGRIVEVGAFNQLYNDQTSAFRRLINKQMLDDSTAAGEAATTQ